MSRTIEKACDLKTALATGDPLFVLFYAAWCPYSRQFLPVYEKHSEGRDADFIRIALDGNEDVFEEFEIDVYPTVLFFDGGRVSKRLDGKHFAGLKEKQLVKLVESCRRASS